MPPIIADHILNIHFPRSKLLLIFSVRLENVKVEEKGEIQPFQKAELKNHRSPAYKSLPVFTRIEMLMRSRVLEKN